MRSLPFFLLLALGLSPLGGALAWAQVEGGAASAPSPEAAGNQATPAPQSPSTQLPSTQLPSTQLPPRQLPPPPLPPLRPNLPSASAPLPLRPNFEAYPSKEPQRFDQSLEALVRQGVITPGERSARLRGGAMQMPIDVAEQLKGCSSGALSQEECRTGFAVRFRGRSNNETIGAGLGIGLERLGIDGQPLPPLTVPVSALLAGTGGSFDLAQVFRVTPRPAPLLGNGNRSLLFPVSGSAMITSGFGWRLHPVMGSWLMHAGRDLAAPEGTPVVAALSGRVVSSGLAGGYGVAVEIEHSRPLRRSLYGHLSEFYVQPGEWVRQGEVIGRVGSTGLSTGPHLHFELRLPQDGGWVAVDPGELDPGREAAGTDTIALLMGQLLQSLERPKTKGA